MDSGKVFKTRNELWGYQFRRTGEKTLNIMADSRKLNIVDENDQIIGEDTRENIHRKGLLHREIHVWFYTPKSEIVFQHRAKNKDTFPDLLDATVGGHVEN